MITKTGYAALAALFLLPACGGDTGLPDVTQLYEPEPIRTRGVGPPGADPDSCYGKDASPAVIETVTHQVMMQPAEIAADGAVLYPAVYKTETVQEIVEPRRELWFETICAEDLTPEFIASLQRALAARDHYSGTVTGEMTARTRHAIRAYQKPQGLDSAILSLAAARQLGLMQVERIEE